MNLKTLDISMAVRQAIANAESIDEISDCFCFIVGFISSELLFRLSKVEKESDKENMELQQAALEAAWDAYKKRLEA